MEWNGSSLGNINRPQSGMSWSVAAEGRVVIQWPAKASPVFELIKLKGQYQVVFSEFVDFVFLPQKFRKKIKVQVDPVNRHWMQL